VGNLLMTDHQFKVHVESLPGLKTSDDPELDTKEKVLWIKLADAGLLVGPGYLFAADTEDERMKTEAHFRLSFSTVDVSVLLHGKRLLLKYATTSEVYHDQGCEDYCESTPPTTESLNCQSK
jgi:hypothetical protein